MVFVVLFIFGLYDSLLNLSKYYLKITVSMIDSMAVSVFTRGAEKSYLIITYFSNNQISA